MDSDKKTFKILSIDGGGIKGLYSARVLQHLEEKYGTLSDYFDMICGTSTGGLIALGLSLRIPAKDLVKFYTEKGPSIFPERRKYFWLRWYDFARQSAFFGKFSDSALKTALTDVFGEKLIGESNNLLCIPSYLVTEGKPRVFKKDYGDLDCDDMTPYVDVALATSAAPTFFPLAEIKIYDNYQFIDGGVWANNPTLVGYVEAMTRIIGEDYGSLDILSVSSLNLTGGRPVGMRRMRSFIGWKDDLFETAINGQAKFTDYFMKHINKISKVPVNYLRIPSVEIGSKQESFIQLDVASKRAIDLILAKGNSQGAIYKKMTEVAEFFKNKKTYHLNN